MLTVSNDVVNKIIKIVQDGGGSIYEQEGYINLFGVRSPVTDNTFNDTLYIFWKEGGQYKCVKTTGFLTKPGESSVHGTIKSPNAKGVAILRKGWHKDIWHHGLHKGEYKALRQYTNVTVYRDKTQYGQKGPYKLNLFTNTLDEGYFGINFHKTGNPHGKTANGWSAGCQTFKYLSEFNEAMQMANAATSRGQKTFNYYLANLDEFEAGGVIDEKGTAYDFSQSSQFGGQVNGGSQHSTSGAYGGCGSVGQLGSYTNTPEVTVIHQQTQNREEVLNTLVSGSYSPNEIKKCAELISSDKKKNKKTKSES